VDPRDALHGVKVPMVGRADVAVLIFSAWVLQLEGASAGPTWFDRDSVYCRALCKAAAARLSHAKPDVLLGWEGEGRPWVVVECGRREWCGDGGKEGREKGMLLSASRAHRDEGDSTFPASFYLGANKRTSDF